MSAILVKSFVGQAEAYFEKELTNERENYYSEKSTNVGQWTGKGAEALGLKGDIKKEDFSKISRGIDPTTGERFRRMTFGRTREINGEIKQVKEIAGWDMVISAPKSISIAGLIGNDERVIIAHEEAVTDALDRAEQQAQSNNGGGKKEQTSNLVVGRFSHDSARPSKDGFVAPQLHDHCFIMNATLRADGTLKPLESLELHKAQSYIKSVYYTGLADRLQKLGYGVEIDKETGAPEITGISKEYRAACSPRRAEILDLAEKAGKNFRQLGLVNRREKIFDKDLIQEQHKGIDGIFDFQAERIVESAKENPRPAGENSASEREAKEAVTFALAKLSERESVFAPRRILLEANKRGIGKTSVTAIEAELETRKKEEQVKTVSLSDGRKAAFLSSDEKIEAELPKHIKALKPQETLRDEILKTNLSDQQKAADEIEFRKLSNDQQKAVSEIMRATTGVVTLEGRAGVGKTTTLSFVNKIAEKAEYEVLGLAPTTGAAQELDNAKITSSTLQKLLVSQDVPRDHKRFFIVDESSFVSSRQMDKFFREAVKPNDRVLFVGDTRQHEGVEAGKPFARIQREELTTGAKVETIRRQTKETSRETVKNLSEGKIIEAVEAMRQRGQVVEVKDRAKRHNAIVEVFASEPEKSLVVAPRNTDRQEINSKIHEALKDAGKVGKAETEIKILRPRNELSGVEREFAAAYREGDIISYTRGSAENKIAAKSLARVVGTDREQNLLTVEIKDARSGTEAREITYNPKRLRGVSVWTEEKIKVSTGDRLQLRAPFEEKNAKIANGTMLEVGEITPEVINLTTDKGKAVKLDTKRPHAIDYGYAVTSHSSQGKTIDRVLIHAETTESKHILNERMAYVAVSRARNEALIFTDDAQKLAFKMARQIEKTEITQTKAETVEHAPECAEKIVLDTKPEFEKAERSEIKQPVILPPVEKLPTPRIEIEPAREKTIVLDAKPAILPAVEKSPTPEIQTAQQKTIAAGDVQKNRQETLIEEVLEMSRDSLAKQGIEPKPEAWKQFAATVINDAPSNKANESQERILELLQKNAPQSERISLTEKTSLEATHAILKLAPSTQRGEIVKGTLAKIEKELAAERDDIVIKPEIKPEVKAERSDAVKPEIKVITPEVIETAKTTSFEKAAGEQVKPTLKVRDFAGVGREELISEVVAAARDEARAWTGEDLSYRQQKRLTKIYRQIGDTKPQEKQINDLNALQNRFDEPMPQPNTFLEATVLKLDNITDAEKSAALRGQIIKLDEFIRQDESGERESPTQSSWNVQPFFIREPNLYQAQQEKQYFAQMAEAQNRNLVKPGDGIEEMQKTIEQMQNANFLQDQIKRSLDEQGIKLEPLAQRIVNSTVDSYIKQQPTQQESAKVQEIAQSTGIEVNPVNKLEAVIYICHQDEQERDKTSYALASAATERADQIKAEQVITKEKTKDLEMEYENPTIGRSL